MDISTGGIIGLLRVLFKPIVDFIEKALFRTAFEVSSAHQIHKELYLYRPQELYPNIQYKVLWQPFHLGEKLSSPMFWLKADEGHSFSKIVVTISAKNSKICYQDRLVLSGVSKVPIKSALPSIPFRKITFRGGSVFTPYDNVVTKIDELYDLEGNSINLEGRGYDSFTPLDRLEEAIGWEEGYVERWGEIYNLRLIESEIKELNIRLVSRGFNKRFFGYAFRQKLFSRKWLMRILFWSRNIFFAKQLLSVFNEYQKDFKKKNL